MFQELIDDLTNIEDDNNFQIKDFFGKDRSLKMVFFCK